MDNICVGDRLQMLCYKHNGKPHCSWDEVIVLDVQDDYIACGDYKATVTESNGMTWKTKEPAIIYFFKDRWYNIIVQLKRKGIFYYCNILSPYIIEDGMIKYIDYDLDLRIFPSGEYKILDKGEYKYHKRIMNYSSDLEKAIKNGMDDLIKFYKTKPKFFDKEYNKELYNIYKELKNKETE